MISRDEDMADIKEAHVLTYLAHLKVKGNPQKNFADYASSTIAHKLSCINMTWAVHHGETVESEYLLRIILNSRDSRALPGRVSTPTFAFLQVPGAFSTRLPSPRCCTASS